MATTKSISKGSLKHKPVLVIWQDAASIDEWGSEADAASEVCPLIHSVGLLISKDSEKITLALNHDTATDSISCVMLIPSGMVKAFIPL